MEKENENVNVKKKEKDEIRKRAIVHYYKSSCINNI